jgi:leucyl/phenylalanyl-tRNA---protein transferase
MPLLDPELMLRAYSLGVFPMADSRDADKVFWVEPRRRAIIPLDSFHPSRTLRKRIRSGAFIVTRDEAFAQVVRQCAAREETWINDEIEQSYLQLHRLGHAHSVECWTNGALVGGLYGVKLGAAFFGESMFSQRTDASKVALAWLVARLRAGHFQLLDCQFMTDHLRSLGAIEISQKDYLVRLAAALSPAAAVGAGGGGGAGAASFAGATSLPGVDFTALDRLLGMDPALTVDASASGCFIAQLLGQTS